MMEVTQQLRFFNGPEGLVSYEEKWKVHWLPLGSGKGSFPNNTKLKDEKQLPAWSLPPRY